MTPPTPTHPTRTITAVDLVSFGPTTDGLGEITTVTPPTPTHPTRTLTAKITCVLTDDDDGFEITVEAERYRSWRFVVADPAPYPVGSTITLQVPA